MKILIVIGDCLQVNSSANLCHLTYIKGFVDAGHEVTLLSSSSKNRLIDLSMSIPKEVKSYTYDCMTFYERMAKLKNKIRKQTSIRDASSGQNEVSESDQTGSPQSFLKRIKARVKNRLYHMNGIHGIYAKFLKKAQRFQSDEVYDCVISISTPVVSHEVVNRLLKSKNIVADRWIQIWEDPWYLDVKGLSVRDEVYQEEQRLLNDGQFICYVSPITLKYQQKLHPQFAGKMYWQPLPFYYEESQSVDFDDDQLVFGYFGDYQPEARNLRPFYEAAKELSASVNICGNPSHLFESTDTIHIYPRMPLSELKDIENQTNVLVFLCNKKGGQIPGKIYQYSATTKTILFILDGTQEEKDELYHFFAKFHRYVFCENTKEDIMQAINDIVNHKCHDIENRSLIDQFNPVIIVENILKGK